MKPKIKIIALTILVYGIPILLWSIIPFTKNLWGSFASDPLLNYLFYGQITHSAMGIIFDFFLLYCIYLLFFKKNILIEKERVYLISSGIKKLFSLIFRDKLKKQLLISKEEKTSLLFYLVKLFWTPLMIGFAIGNTSSVIGFFSSFSTLNLNITKIGVLKFYIPFIFALMIAIDTLIFSFGYIFESSALKNVVKSVEPTVLGWLVAIMCYPPINDLSTKILGWYSSDFNDFGNININIITGIISLLLFGVYVWASIALGFKASNLTNRGIISKGPYKYVRHPAYSTKNLSWWIMGIPFIKMYGLIAIYSLIAWSFVYYLRALTEERHLMQDPDYVEYSKKVKYMFIPGLF